MITPTLLVTKLRESGQGGGLPLLENLDPGHDWAEKAPIGIVCFIHDECVHCTETTLDVDDSISRGYRKSVYTVHSQLSSL